MSATIISLACVIALPLRVLAGWDRATVGTVDILELDTYGGFNVSLAGSPILCSGATDKWAQVHAIASAANGSVEGLKAMYATLLAAKLSGKAVRLYTLNSNHAPPDTVCILGAADLW